MKGSFKLHEHQQKKKEEDLSDWVIKQPCCICNKKLGGAYGQWSQSDDSTLWTCSKTCDETYKEKRNAT